MTTPEAGQLEAIDWRNLIQAGNDLLNLASGANPSDEHIRRAVSNAYYAMVHALAASNAYAIIDTPHNNLTAAAWMRVYRGLDHGKARREFQIHGRELSVDAENFASVFTQLQARRHSADYDPTAAFNVQDTRLWLAIAAYACLAYLEADSAERTCIAALTTIDRRRD